MKHTMKIRLFFLLVAMLLIAATMFSVISVIAEDNNKLCEVVENYLYPNVKYKESFGVQIEETGRDSYRGYHIYVKAESAMHIYEGEAKIGIGAQVKYKKGSYTFTKVQIVMIQLALVSLVFSIFLPTVVKKIESKKIRKEFYKSHGRW